MDLTYFTILVSPYFHLMGFPFNPSLPDFMFALQASERTCGTGEWGTRDSILSCLGVESCHRRGFLLQKQKGLFNVKRYGVLHWTFLLINYSKIGPL